jgi:hypothetical protein
MLPKLIKNLKYIVCWLPHPKIKVYGCQQYYLQMTRIGPIQYAKFTKKMITSRERRITAYLLKLKTQFIGYV